MSRAFPFAGFRLICFTGGVSLALLFGSAAPSFSQNSGCEMDSIKIGSTTERAEANFQRLSGCLRDLTHRLARAEQELSRMRDGLLSPPTETRNISGNALKCPDGYYLTAAVFQDQSGLAHGALWGPSGTCAKLNVGSR
jgi:hypothetical protein